MDQRPQPQTNSDDHNGVPPLTSLYLYLSGACNLACRHCWIAPAFQPDSGGDGPHLRLAYVKKAVTQGLPLGLGSVKLTGGEPTLHPRFREIVAAIANAGVTMTMESNGTLIDGALARFMRDSGKIRSVSISLDGADAETHDALRGVPGSFQKALDGIDALAKAGFSPQVICTLHQGNVHQIGELLALAADRGCGSVKFNHLQLMGRGEGFDRKMGLGVRAILDLYHRLETESAFHNGLKVHFDVPLAFQPIRKLLRDPIGLCHIHNILGILSGGEMALCGIGEAEPAMVYGHLAQDDLASVWRSSPGLESLRRLVPAQLEGICGNCIHSTACKGECVANNYHLHRRIQAPNHFCRYADEHHFFPESRLRRPNIRCGNQSSRENRGPGCRE